jgi:hypothetical protein
MQEGGSGLFHFIIPVICRNTKTTDLQPIRQKAGKKIEIQAKYISPTSTQRYRQTKLHGIPTSIRVSYFFYVVRTVHSEL